MKKGVFLLILVFLLIGILSAEVIQAVEQDVEGVLLGLTLQDQKVRVGDCLEADFGNYSGNLNNSIETKFDNVSCNIDSSGGLEGLKVYGDENSCIVELCNVTKEDLGGHSISIKALSNEGFEDYVFDILVYNYKLDLNPKWNLVSIPVNSINKSLDYIFKESQEVVDEVWSYENGVWKVYYSNVSKKNDSNLKYMVPGRGYWIRSNKDTSIYVGGNLIEPVVVPPLVELEEGWNLIGPYSFESRIAYCSLFSLADVQKGFPRWSALFKFDSITQNFIGLYSHKTDLLNAGEGYWIQINTPEKYVPSTGCPLEE